MESKQFLRWQTDIRIFWWRLFLHTTLRFCCCSVNSSVNNFFRQNCALNLQFYQHKNCKTLSRPPDQEFRLKIIKMCWFWTIFLCLSKNYVWIIFQAICKARTGSLFPFPLLVKTESHLITKFKKKIAYQETIVHKAFSCHLHWDVVVEHLGYNTCYEMDLLPLQSHIQTNSPSWISWNFTAMKQLQKHRTWPFSKCLCCIAQILT